MNDQRPPRAYPVDRPIFWEPARSFLKYTIAFVLAGSAAFVAAIFIFAPEQAVRAFGPASMSLVAVIAGVLRARGRIEAAVHALAFGLWAAVTGIAFFTGGVQGMAIIVYPQLILLLGWLIGTRAAVAMALLAVAATLGFALAESWGVLPPPPVTHPAMRWIVQSFIFAFSVILVVSFVRSYQERLREAGKLGSDLALRTIEVQAREADLNRAQAVARVGSWVYDIASDVTRLSAEACRIFGLPEGTTRSRASYLAHVHPDDRGDLERAWQAAHEGGAPFDHEHRIRVGKTIRWVRQKAELELAADGRPMRSVGTTQDVTERKHAEAALQESESRFRHLTQLSSDWYWEQDENCRFTFISSGVDVQQRGVDEHIGKTRWELPHVDTDPAVIRENDALVAARKPFRDLVIKRMGRDQTVHYALISGEPVFDEHGQFKGYRGVGSDITGRKRAEEALRKSEERYRTLFANSNVAMLLIDPADGGIVDANASACAYYGWELADLRAKRIADINTLGADAVQAEMERAHRLKRRHFEFRHRRADGAVRDVEVYSGPVEIDGRELLLSIVQDVTERNKAQDELRKSIAFRELLLEALPLPVFYKDTAGRYAGGNRAFAAFIGKTMNEIVGKTAGEVWPDGYAQAYSDKDVDLLADPLGLQTYESRVPHADGTVHDVISHKARIVDGAGRPTGILGVLTDITELKRIQAARDQLEAQLRESQKMEALGTLAGGVAHDFNNIVATIMGNVELALRDVGPARAAQESLEEIRKASRRAKELVQQILAFGRRQVIERKVIALAPVVEESARLLRATLPAGVGLSVTCAPDAPPVLADATQVQQVLLNLCANAWQAMQGQRGAVEVRLGAYDHAPGDARSAQAVDRRGELRPGRYACLTVRDDGPGMDQATRSRIFEPFFTTKPVGKGTGLGLAVVHGIVQEHGASIEVESSPGAGTTFRVCFPAVVAAVAAATVPVQDGAPAHGQGRRILYVDDDEAIVFLMTRLLERQGYRVSGYTDAREALAAVRAQPQAYDLAVTDYNMPGMSGLEVARALREIRADLPLALASGYITEELRAQAPAAGVSELIYKPNTVDELCEAVARLTNAQRVCGQGEGK